MKKTIFFALMCCMLAMFCCVSLTSCGDDDDDDNGSNALIGTWKSVSYSYTEGGKTYEGTDDDDNYMLLVITDSTLTFTEYMNGKAESTGTESYTLKGNRIVVDGDDSTFYKIIGSSLTLTTVYDNGDSDMMTYKRM